MLCTYLCYLLFLKFREEINIKQGANETHDRKEDDNTANDSVDDDDTCLIELGTDLVDHPCQSIPPQQGTTHHGSVAHTHKQWLFGDDEIELCKECDEKEDDACVGENDEESGDAIVDGRTFLFVSTFICVLQWIAEETNESE